MLGQRTNNSLSDQDLIDKILEDKNNFSIIVERYSGKLSRYINRITSVSPQDCDDILQNIFIKIYINLNSYDTDFSFNAWVYRIAHNEIIDTARKHKRINDKGYMDINDEFLQFCKQSMGILEIHYKSEDEQRFKQSFDAMTPKYKEVLFLRYIEMYSYRDISDILKKTEANVTSMIHRAKKEFKKHYQTLL